MRKIAEFGHEFLADFRRGGPFIFPQQRQAEKVVRMRRARIQSDGTAKFTNGVVLHLRVAISVAEEHVK